MFIRSFLFSAAVSLMPLYAGASYGQHYAIDPAQSSVKWAGKKIVGSGHHGTVRLQSGHVEVKDGNIVRGSFMIDMTSIENEDLSSASQRTRLVNHLKSDDFFSVATHPTASFSLTEAKRGQNNQWQINGNLTIKGISHPISFPATITMNEASAKATAKLSFDRARYEVRYNSGRFFDPRQLGDNLINDDIAIELSLVAVKRAADKAQPGQPKQQEKQGS